MSLFKIRVDWIAKRSHVRILYGQHSNKFLNSRMNCGKMWAKIIPLVAPHPFLNITNLILFYNYVRTLAQSYPFPLMKSVESIRLVNVRIVVAKSITPDIRHASNYWFTDWSKCVPTYTAARGREPHQVNMVDEYYVNQKKEEGRKDGREEEIKKILKN